MHIDLGVALAMAQEAVDDREAQEQVVAQVATQAMRDPMRVPPHNPSAPVVDQLSGVQLNPPSPGGTLDPNARENVDAAGGPTAITTPLAHSPLLSLNHRFLTPCQRRQ